MIEFGKFRRQHQVTNVIGNYFEALQRLLNLSFDRRNPNILVQDLEDVTGPPGQVDRSTDILFMYFVSLVLFT
jgi:hypothetical protein